jgi:ABC-2 type transport system permease protein
MLRKDLRILRRSPILLGLLVSYPVIIALLVGLVAGYANTKPRVALVDEDNLPPVVEIAGQKFGVSKTIAEVAHNVKLVRMSSDDAEGQLRSGKIVGVITVPPGFIADLRTTMRSPSLIVETGTGGVTPRVQQQMQALVYQLNRKLQRAFIAANLRYVTLILNGGDGSFIGRDFHVLGLERTQKLLASLPPSQRVARIKEFVRVARLALAQTGNALQATANPIRLEERGRRGRTWVLSAQVQAYGIGLTITFLALLLAAGSAAAERDENVIGRLGRGLDLGRPAVRPRRPLLRLGALRPEPMGDPRARDPVARRPVRRLLGPRAARRPPPGGVNGGMAARLRRRLAAPSSGCAGFAGASV